MAVQTLAAVDAAIATDSANSFRRNLGLVLPHIGDIYREDDDEHRTHLGASVIGGKCARAIAYGFRWATGRKSPRGKKNENPITAASRMYRLWNRGHMEEARFIAMLMCAGVQVYQQDAEGKQFRINAHGGHFSGSGDGILYGVPDLPAGVPCLGEFKTHSNKSFEDLLDDGVRKSKPEHFVQMQEYMHGFGLLYALYMAVNKDTDQLYGEIVMYERPIAEQFLDRAGAIIFSEALPDRMRGASPGFHVCKYMCDHVAVCYSTTKPERNCRTCRQVMPTTDGQWVCRATGEVRDKQAQAQGCDSYQLTEAMQ